MHRTVGSYTSSTHFTAEGEQISVFEANSAMAGSHYDIYMYTATPISTTWLGTSVKLDRCSEAFRRVGRSGTPRNNNLFSDESHCQWRLLPYSGPGSLDVWCRINTRLSV